jgi:Zn-dependent protease with chaperone function
VDGLPEGATMDETFFAAQRRHRAAARLWSVVAAFAALLQGIPMALMLAPVAIAAAVIAADVANLVTPVPDLWPAIRDLLAAPGAERAADGTPGGGTTGADPALPLGSLALLAVPGLLFVLFLWWFVRRFLLRDGLGGVLITAGARPADRGDPEEHQLVNIVEEISLAAGIAPPRVLVLPAEVPNAAAFGRSPRDWTIAVSRGLLDDLDRDATQGVVAHLVGSVGNGDLRLQHSLLSLFVSYQLAQDLITVPFASSCRRRARRVWRMLRRRARPEEEAETIRELLVWDESANFVVSFNLLTFKIVQFYTTLFVVGGFLTLPFRARRYLADATAVQLARTPDGLGRALVHLQRRGRNLPGAEFAAIYTITASDALGQENTVEDVATLPAQLSPPLRKRVERLRRLGFRGGADPDEPPRGLAAMPRILRWPLTALLYLVLALLVVPLLVLLVLAVLTGIALSVFLGVLFWTVVTGIVAGPLHVFLRGIA